MPRIGSSPPEEMRWGSRAAASASRLMDGSVYGWQTLRLGVEIPAMSSRLRVLQITTDPQIMEEERNNPSGERGRTEIFSRGLHRTRPKKPREEEARDARRK